MKTVIKQQDGRVAIMTLVDGADLSEALRKWSDVNPGKYLFHREMEDSAIPEDREFREAWTDITPEAVIDIDMVKAKAIHIARIRVKRDAELARLDIEAVRAEDMGLVDELKKIREMKQVLRDIPQAIQADLDAAKTVDELKFISMREWIVKQPDAPEYLKIY